MSSSSQPAPPDDRNLPCHHVVGLNYLFHESEQDNFPKGCTMVLSGPPGAGKTTFALGLVRSMLRGADKGAEVPTSLVAEEPPKHIVYYISTEVNRDRLRRMFLTRGWFAKEDDFIPGTTDKYAEDDLFAPNPRSGRTSGLHVINPPLEIERPVKSSEELVNFIVRQIAAQPPPEKDQLVFIVVDSITSLFKDTEGGDSRRQVHELIHRLRGQFAKTSQTGSHMGQLGMIILLSEQGIENIESPGLETYVADFVLTLGLKSLSMGTRLRTLEITKSQGANMMMGTHTWHIVTAQSLERLVSGKTLRQEVYDKVSIIEGRAVKDDSGAGKENAPWGSIMVGARPYFRLHRAEEEAPGGGEQSTGICGLDEMLRFDPDYWFMDPKSVISARQKSFLLPAGDQDHDNMVHASIKPGSVTMLVGEPGTGKTSLCNHLVASHLALNQQDESRKQKEIRNVALLVGFEHDFSHSFQRFGGKFRYGPMRGEAPYLEKEQWDNKQHVDCEFIYRPRSGLHFNLLLLELRTWLRKNATANKRVVIDGISHLVSTQTKQEFSQMLDALVALFAEYPTQHDVVKATGEKKKKGGNKAGAGKVATKATLFLTYDALQHNNALDPAMLQLPADNIVCFSHIVIEDMRRTAVSVIKSAQPEYDNLVRELVLDHENPAQTHISSGFDAYAGLLDGRVHKAEVVLKLFRENDREKAYNQALRQHLNKLLPYHIVLRDFSRFDITSALDGKSEHVKMPSGDVLVVHSDEWWLAHKVQVLDKAAAEARELTTAPGGLESTAWRRFRQFVADNNLTKLAGFVGVDQDSPISPGDFWCFEMEKAWKPDAMGASPKNIGPYALPAYLDFGMLCVHRSFRCEGVEEMPPCHTQYAGWDTGDKLPWEPAAWTVKTTTEKPDNRKRYTDLLQECMLPWCDPAAVIVKKKQTVKRLQELASQFNEKDTEMWFRASSKGGVKTLVSLMRDSLSQSNQDDSPVHYGFAWDSRTPETAACFLYELAWAFGGPQDLFGENEQERQRAVFRALRFIGYLVHEGLMPVCPTLTDTAHAVFSRHFFSTYTDVVNRSLPIKVAEKTSGGQHTGLPLKVEDPVLVSLGFMPPGPPLVGWQDGKSIQEDGAKRIERADERLAKFVKLAMRPQPADDTENTKPRSAEKDQKQMSLEKAGEQFRDQRYSTLSPNLRDLDELQKWRKFRESLGKKSSWPEAMDAAAKIAAGLAQVESRQEPQQSSTNGLRTGYGCCGAWMVGIKSPTGAPGLAQVLLQEITSLEFAKKRARMGAGLPARQDFYRHYGDRPVTGMEYLTWSEMLMCLGSTARRRDRVYADPYKSEPETVKDDKTVEKIRILNDPARMHRLIHHAVTEIMHVAARAQPDDPSPIIEAAADFTRKLFAEALPRKS